MLVPVGKRPLALSLILLGAAGSGLAQLSTSQKVSDFEQLMALYAKQYGPYVLKRDVLGFDLLNTKPWIDRVQSSTSDLEFYEVSAEYVTALNDVHSEYIIPSNFFADSGLRADIYDGKVLIESIDRSVLPKSLYPFAVGDEIVSVDGKSAEDWIKELSRYQSFGNDRSTRRWVSQYIPARMQAVFPRAPEIGDTSEFVIKLQSGDIESYPIFWTKYGRPLVNEGPVDSPYGAGQKAMRKGRDPNVLPVDDGNGGAGKDLQPDYSRFPAYLQSALRLQYSRAPRKGPVMVRGFGSRTPIFRIPGLTIRLGRSAGDFFYSGWYESGTSKIGFIRIPDFAPIDFSLLDYAYQQFDDEIAWMRANTDGLVVDVMRNPGGFGCYGEELMRRLVPYRFITVGFEIRPTLSWVNGMYDDLELAYMDGAEQWVLDLLGTRLDQVESAFAENRGMTGPLPLCTPQFERDPTTDESGAVIAYEKPMILLTDEFTTSAGDLFAAMFQDAKRGPLVGWRTAGAGGNVEHFNVGFYSEGLSYVTQSLMVRPNSGTSPDFANARVIENVGVTPDIPVDYMTLDNLLNSGKTFVETFTSAIDAEIAKTKK